MRSNLISAAVASPSPQDRARSSRGLHKPRHCLALVGVLCCLAVVGCSAGAETSSNKANKFHAEGFIQNQDSYTLPLDDYSPDTADDEFARNILVAGCMEAKGIFWPVPKSAAISRPPSENAEGRQLFNLRLAKNSGYHTGPYVEHVDPTANVTLSKSQQEALKTCATEADTKIGVNVDTRNLVESLQVAAYRSAVNASAVLEAARAWRECMLRAKFSDVPSDPTKMPTGADRQRWFAGGPVTDAKLPSVGGPEEIRAATIDAQCRKSSGYAEAQYQAEVDAQLGLMAQNASALERAMENAKAATAVIQAAIKKQYG